MLTIYLSVIETAENQSLFETIYYTYRKQMYSVAYGILKDKGLAEDAVQEAFLRTAKQIALFREMPEDRLSAYVLIAAKNAALNIYNKEQKYSRNIISIEDVPPLFIEDNAFTQQINNERQRTLVAIITELPSFQRSILTLRYAHDMKCSEIAIALGRKSSTVRKELSRVRRVLAEKCRKAGLESEN